MKANHLNLARLAAMTGLLIVGALAISAAYGQTPQRPDSYDSSAPGAAHPPAATSTPPKVAPGDMARKVRAALSRDMSLSESARKVRVSSQAGKVTLSGVVGSPDERRAVVARASEVAGEGNVVDKLKVVGKT
jgi:BON domain